MLFVLCVKFDCLFGSYCFVCEGKWLIVGMDVEEVLFEFWDGVVMVYCFYLFVLGNFVMFV